MEVPKSLVNPTQSDVKQWLEEPSMGKEVALFPMTSAKLMYYIHQHYTELELNWTFQETKHIQEKVKSLLPFLPDGMLICCLSEFSLLSLVRSKMFVQCYSEIFSGKCMSCKNPIGSNFKK